MAIHRFIGDREIPTPLASIRTRRPLLGTGKIPAELRAMARSRTLYTATDLNKKPQVDIDYVPNGGKHLWKIQVPVGDELRGARAGLTLERHPGEKFLKDVKETASFKSHRPDWIDALPVPAPDVGQGRAVDAPIRWPPCGAALGLRQRAVPVSRQFLAVGPGWPHL